MLQKMAKSLAIGCCCESKGILTRDISDIVLYTFEPGGKPPEGEIFLRWTRGSRSVRSVAVKGAGGGVWKWDFESQKLRPMMISATLFRSKSGKSKVVPSLSHSRSKSHHLSTFLWRIYFSLAFRLMLCDAG